MINISERLKMVASLITAGGVLADVGTDHGYIPIYLVALKRIPREIRHAIAMDINEGPLARAKDHIEAYGMEAYIQTRLSDGVQALEVGEADSIVIAGMGGGLVMHILAEGAAVCHAAKELVLQPQSQLKEVRYFLARNGYVTDAEQIIKEDGKYYPMMRVHYAGDVQPDPDEVSAKYGAGLLKICHPVLLEYLKKEQKTYEGILGNLEECRTDIAVTAERQKAGNEKILQRRNEIREILAHNAQAQAYYILGD